MTAELIPSATALMYSGDLPFNIDILTNGIIVTFYFCMCPVVKFYIDQEILTTNLWQ